METVISVFVRTAIIIWISCSKAATSVEYALLAAGIAGAILASMFLVSDSFEGMLETLGSAMREAGNEAGT